MGTVGTEKRIGRAGTVLWYSTYWKLRSTAQHSALAVADKDEDTLKLHMHVQLTSAEDSRRSVEMMPALWLRSRGAAALSHSRLVPAQGWSVTSLLKMARVACALSFSPDVDGSVSHAHGSLLISAARK